MSSIYLPGRGMVDLGARHIDKAVREYDDRLFFAHNESTGQWTVFVRMPRDWDGPEVGGEGKALAVLAFPPGTDPQTTDVEYVIHRIRESDSQRRGDAILRELNRENDSIHAAHRATADEGAGIAAEAMESFLHDQGRTPYTRILRPTKKTAVRGH